jgi:hypothetical protein
MGLRHTYATFLLDQGMSIFKVARWMGTSAEMIERHYGHWLIDSDERELGRLDRPSTSARRTPTPYPSSEPRPVGPAAATPPPGRDNRAVLASSSGSADGSDALDERELHRPGLAPTA